MVTAMSAYAWNQAFSPPRPNLPVPNIPVPARREERPVPDRQTAPQKLESTKPLMASLDIDRTAIPWKTDPEFDVTAYLRYQRQLHDPEFRKNTFVMLNTGRGLRATKELAPIISRFPIDALGVNDGEQVFFRPKDGHGDTHPVEETQRWLMNLKQKDADTDWRRRLGGWSTIAVSKDIRFKQLPALGFEEEWEPDMQARLNPQRQYHLFTRPKNPDDPAEGKWLLAVRPDQSCFGVTHLPEDKGKPASPEEATQFATQLGVALKSRMAQDWPRFETFAVTTPEGAFFHFGPKGNSKAGLINYMIEERMPKKPMAVISAGDGGNDVPLLSRNELAGVPNFPIFVGESARALDALRQSNPPRLEQVPWNQLDVGLAKQFAKLKPALPGITGQPKPDQEKSPSLMNRFG